MKMLRRMLRVTFKDRMRNENNSGIECGVSDRG